VKRFISCFCEEAILSSKRVLVEVNGLKFSANGTKIEKKGWMHVYPHSTKEGEVVTMNGSVDVLEIRTEEKETKPPRRYSAASLVKELEKRGLGTKATRAGIVETLYSRGYAREKSIEVTELGMRMEETLEKYSPVILDEAMTKDMTEELEKIEVATKDFEKMEKKILDKAKKEVTKIAEEMSKNIEGMGKSLADANAVVWEQEKEMNTMSECPVCKKGNLRVMYGKRFSRYFVSCDNYPDCKTIYGLPPKGVARPSRISKKQAEEQGREENDLELCEECKWPKVALFKKGGAPWRICFNPDCVTNEEAQKKKAEFKAKLASGEIEIDKDGKIIDHGKEERDAAKAKKKVKKVKKKKKKKVVKKK
jgi:DNA topoisomerase-1